MLGAGDAAAGEVETLGPPENPLGGRVLLGAREVTNEGSATWGPPDTGGRAMLGASCPVAGAMGAGWEGVARAAPPENPLGGGARLGGDAGRHCGGDHELSPLVVLELLEALLL